MSQILSKVYAERRLVLIAPETKEQMKGSKLDWGPIIATAVGNGGYVAAAGTGAVWLAALGLGLWPVTVGIAIYKGIKMVTEGSTEPLPRDLHGALVIDHKSAVAELQLPPGHPLIGHAYAGHPLCAPRYLPAAAFHRQLFEEKVNELMTLLASLGATRVRVVCRQGYRSAGGVNLGVSKGASGTIGIEGSKSSSSEAMFEEHFRPKEPPKLPENLIWFGHEPSWQAVADRRLKFNTSKFHAELHYEDSFGIDAKVKVGIEKLGVNLGGHFTDFETTVWEFDGEFA